jgi:hypothetical protein
VGQAPGGAPPGYGYSRFRINFKQLTLHLCPSVIREGSTPIDASPDLTAAELAALLQLSRDMDEPDDPLAHQ